MKIPITKPYFDENEHRLIRQPLETGWVVQGPFVKQFEEQVARFTGTRFAVALNSCTSGQFILSRLIGLQPGDEVIMPAFTWISTANSVEFLGAKAVFCDIDINTFNIDAEHIEKLVNPRTKAVYPVHLFGLCAPMDGIRDIARRHDLAVIEDCACGIGGRIGDTHCGAFGQAGVFSFHPRKSITTGEGGMIVTNDESIARQAQSLREHGAVKTEYDRHHNQNGFLLTDYPVLGYNMRMTDIQGALGVAQMEKLPRILDKKQQLAREYNERLKDIPWLKAPVTPGNYTHGYQGYCTLFKPEETMEAIQNRDLPRLDKLNSQRNRLMAALEDKGIAVRQGTHTIHIQQLYREKYNYRPMDYPAAYAADRLSLALPFFPTITREEIDYVFDTLLRVITT